MVMAQDQVSTGCLFFKKANFAKFQRHTLPCLLDLLLQEATNLTLARAFQLRAALHLFGLFSTASYCTVAFCAMVIAGQSIA